MVSEQLVDPRQRRELLGFGHMVIVPGPLLRGSRSSVRVNRQEHADGVGCHHGLAAVSGGWAMGL